MGYISDAEATSTYAYESAKTAMEGGVEVSDEAQDLVDELRKLSEELLAMEWDEEMDG